MVLRCSALAATISSSCRGRSTIASPEAAWRCGRVGQGYRRCNFSHFAGGMRPKSAGMCSSLTYGQTPGRGSCFSN
jgi:hypothetical protein